MTRLQRGCGSGATARGPVVAPRGDEGFGGVLSRIAVANQPGGEIARDWNPQGLTIRLSIPRSRLEA
jgi:hypothetical protein